MGLALFSAFVDALFIFCRIGHWVEREPIVSERSRILCRALLFLQHIQRINQNVVRFGQANVSRLSLLRRDISWISF